MRLALIANPGSGGGSEPSEIADALSDGGWTVDCLDLDDLPQRADADRIVVAGGDGSIGPAAALASRSSVPLAVVPTGTANDFARALELPDDPGAAVELAARTAPRLRRVDLATAPDGRVWVNCAATGLSVTAARRAQPLKGRLGAPAYLVGAVRAAATASPLRVAVDGDGSRGPAGAAGQVIGAPTGAFGGGSSVGAAVADDAALDVVVLTGSRLALARHAYGLRSGRIASFDSVPHARGAVVEVTGAREFNVDGELVELGRQTRFGVDGSVEVVVP